MRFNFYDIETAEIKFNQHIFKIVYTFYKPVHWQDHIGFLCDDTDFIKIMGANAFYLDVINDNYDKSKLLDTIKDNNRKKLLELILNFFEDRFFANN